MRSETKTVGELEDASSQPDEPLPPDDPGEPADTGVRE
jgi:hypothetical protein